MAPMPPVVLSAAANAGGTARVDYQPPGVPVIVEQISVSTNGSQGTANVYLNNLFLLGTSQGWEDSADGTPPIPVGTSDTLSIVWSGVGAGALCLAVFMGEQ